MKQGALSAEAVFAATLVATFIAALLAWRHEANSGSGNYNGLADAKLGKWLVGLSAGTTANSGFVVTGAVGLGYTYGLQWVLLPLSWLIGDLVYWRLFPRRINAVGREMRATTLSELLTSGLAGLPAAILAVLVALIVLICLSGYTSAQWLGGQKFLTGSFGLPNWFSLALFAMLIIGYSAVGGFRGSIYADVVQAVIRVIGTVVALVAVIAVAAVDSEAFWKNIAAAGSGFLVVWPGGLGVTVAFIVGFAAAALGFGLGQPQIVSRYLAGSSPEETRDAWLIYNGFVQFTWIAMTVFGVILRGVMPSIADGETGLSVFANVHLGALATGIIAADVFATIAATSNGLLIAMAQAFKLDIMPHIAPRATRVPLSVFTLVIGGITMAISTQLAGSVYALALGSVSIMGAGLAPAVIVRVMRWDHTAISLLTTIASGFLAAITWKLSDYGAHFNEAGIGIATGLAVHFALAKLRTDRPG
jgi:sodium/proline symporter